MSRKGNCYDNCIMETFFGRLKNEMYYGYEKDYSSFEEFSQAVEDYIEYYNNKRWDFPHNICIGDVNNGSNERLCCSSG